MKLVFVIADITVILVMIKGAEGTRLCWIGFSGKHGWIDREECPGSCIKRSTPRGVQYACWPREVPEGCRPYRGQTVCYCNRPLCNEGGVLSPIDMTIGNLLPDKMTSYEAEVDMKLSSNDERIRCWNGFSGTHGWVKAAHCSGSCVKRDFEKDVEFGCWDNKVPDGCRKVKEIFYCFCNKNLCNAGEMPMVHK